MNRFPLTIEHYMSTVLVTVDPSWPAREALRLMREHEIRHLPVVCNKKVIGLVSRSSVETAQGSRSARPVEIADVMDARPYVVDPEEPASFVARGLAERHQDCAVVAHEDRLHGLFTTTDALLALAACLEDESVPGDARIPPVRPAARKKAKSTSAAKKRARKVSR